MAASITAPPSKWVPIRAAASLPTPSPCAHGGDGMGEMSLRLAALSWALAGLSHGVVAQHSLVIPKFVEETKSAGIDSVYAVGWQYRVGRGRATVPWTATALPAP